MGTGFTLLATSQDNDPVRFRGVLAAQYAYERARALRELLVHVLAGLSLPVWLAAAWPGRIAGELRSAAVAAWLLCVGGLLAAIVSEWRWHRRRASFIVDG
jgi:hypothetical protein